MRLFKKPRKKICILSRTVRLYTPCGFCIFGKKQKGWLGSRVTFAKVTKVALLGGFSFLEKFPKETFYVLFASAKRTKKQPRGLRPSRLPGSGSKFRAVDYLLNRKLCIYQKTSTKICNLVPYRSEYFEPVRDGGFTA